MNLNENGNEQRELQLLILHPQPKYLLHSGFVTKSPTPASARQYHCK